MEIRKSEFVAKTQFLLSYRFTEDILASRIFDLTFRSKGLIGIFLYLTALKLYSLKFRD